VLEWAAVLENPDELRALQDLLDRSMAEAGPHLRSIVTEERRLHAEELCRRLRGMRLLVVATATADGRPLAGPVDGYFLHGMFSFSSSTDAVRMRHLSARAAVSATHLPGESLAVTVHGSAELFDLHGSDGDDLRQAMLEHYLPIQGPAFAEWLANMDGLGARIVPERMFTFHLEA